MRKRPPLEWLTKVEEKKLRKNYEINMKRFEPPYDEHEFLPVVHFFNPVGVGDWYITEISPENIAYGLCCLSKAEIGDVSLDELAQLRLNLGRAIEKETYFDNQGLTLMEWRNKINSSRR